MKVPSLSTMWFIWRLFIAICLVYLAYDLFQEAISKSLLGALALLLISGGFFVLAAIIMSPNLARIFAKPFTAFIDSIYLPGNRDRKPPLDYHMVELYMRTRRYEEAEAALARIIHYYPRELDAYLNLAEVCLKLDDPEAANLVLSKASRRLRKNPEALGAIADAKARVAEFIPREMI